MKLGYFAYLVTGLLGYLVVPDEFNSPDYHSPPLCSLVQNLGPLRLRSGTLDSFAPLTLVLVLFQTIASIDILNL